MTLLYVAVTVSLAMNKYTVSEGSECGNGRRKRNGGSNGGGDCGDSGKMKESAISIL